MLTGVVRDARGVAQMGALVQVLTGDARTIATAFTDQHGRYRIADIVPGLYQVRASAALLVPASQNHLHLLQGGRAVVNLTLTALFDTSSWLPASARHADEAEDDWKWTLRATASRPILRLDQDGNPENTVEGPNLQAKLHGQVLVASGRGEFGESGVQTVVQAQETLAPGNNPRGGSIVSVRVESSGGQALEAVAAIERASALGGGARVVASYVTEPEIELSGARQGLQIATIRSAQQTALGENVALEVGSELQSVMANTLAIRALPFVKLTAHPRGSWRLQYRMATSRETQSYADLSAAHRDVPVAVVSDGKLMLESGRHQEVSVSHNAGRTTVEVAYYHDAVNQSAVSGGSTFTGASSRPPQLTGLMLDPVSGAFQALGGGYATNGARVAVSAPIAAGFWVAAEYASGGALASNTASTAQLPAALAGLHARSTQAAEIAVKGKVAGSGTRLRASYRWQPTDTVTRVDPYRGLPDQAYLSFFFRQRLHCGTLLPPRLDATVDVTNLLAQGYRPFLSADGQTLYFAQSPRTVQAGLSFSF